MYEVRFHGRGGQGAVMAAQSLADAAFIEGNYAVAFPYFGAERRGAPVLAFARVDANKIYRKTQIYKPDYVIVLDDKLIDLINVAEGLSKDGMAILNSTKKPEEIQLENEVRTATVDATTIALDVLGVPITNSVMLGAFAKATGLVKIESIEKGIMDIFGARIGERIAKKNAKAARTAYERTAIGTCKGGRIFKKEKKWLPTYKELPLGLATRAMKTDAGLVGPGSFVENKTGSWRTFKPIIDKEKCIECLFCWFYCPEGCISRTSNGLKIDYDYCKGCGICANECPANAIEMVR
jgi:2-oxoacid:acceptor oxidoreductase gamma subunit (pyruvate/2-ketoisovalerate family)/2-oxoacid:acceptor oxidoreductase delta subunit (pyruvate/2-ketoisovalerate family)